MLFFLGVMMLCTGISELKVKRKTNAIISFTASVFVLFVSIYTF
ncbi:YczI family protein [Bacillus sp. S/N-304-OC-R1]|nr:YczI family protein [Bacillus sp. S/N-304-OC-R1]